MAVWAVVCRLRLRRGCWPALALALALVGPVSVPLSCASPSVAASSSAATAANLTCTRDSSGWTWTPWAPSGRWSTRATTFAVNPHDSGVAVTDTTALYYLDADTGEVRWSVPCPSTNPIAPVVSADGGTIFCATQEGQVVVVPAKGNGTVAFRSGFSPAPQTSDTFRVAFDAASSALLIVVLLQNEGMWALRVPDSAPYGVHLWFELADPRAGGGGGGPFPAVLADIGVSPAGGDLVFQARSWGVGCVLANDTTRFAWTVMDFQLDLGTLIVTDDAVFSTHTSAFTAVRLRDGAALWSVPLSCSVQSSGRNAVLDPSSGSVFVGDCDWPTTFSVHKADAATGEGARRQFWHTALQQDGDTLGEYTLALQSRADGGKDLLVLMGFDRVVRLVAVDTVSGDVRWRSLARPAAVNSGQGVETLPGGRVVWSSTSDSKVRSSCRVRLADRAWFGERVWAATCVVLAALAVAGVGTLLAPAAWLPLSKHGAYVGALGFALVGLVVLNAPPVLRSLRCSFDLDGSEQPVPGTVFPFVLNASALGWFVLLAIVLANALASPGALRVLLRDEGARRRVLRLWAALVARPSRATLLAFVALMGLQTTRPGSELLHTPAFHAMYEAQVVYGCEPGHLLSLAVLVQAVIATSMCVLIAPELPLSVYWAKLDKAHLYSRGTGLSHLALLAVVAFGVVWCARAAFATRGAAAMFVGSVLGCLSLLCLETSDHTRRVRTTTSRVSPVPPFAEEEEEEERGGGKQKEGRKWDEGGGEEEGEEIPSVARVPPNPAAPLSAREAIAAPERNRARLFYLVQTFPERVSSLGVVFGLASVLAAFGTAAYTDRVGTLVCVVGAVVTCAHVYFVSIGKQHLVEAWVDAHTRSLRGGAGPGPGSGSARASLEEHLSPVPGAPARVGRRGGRRKVLPDWLHPSGKSSWHHQQLTVTAYQFVNLLFFAYVIPQLKDEQDMAPLAWFGLACALVGVAVPLVTVRGVTSRALTHWIPLDNSFRVSNLLKSATLIVKLMLLTLATALSHPSASQRTLDVVLVVFYVLGGIVVGILTWIDFRSLWEVPFTGRLWTSRGLVVAYAVGFAWTMVGLAFLLLNVHNSAPFQAQVVNTILIVLVPTTSYINNETVRYFIGCRIHPNRLDQALLPQELSRPDLFPRGGMFSREGLDVLNEWQLLVTVLCLGYSCHQLNIHPSAHGAFLVPLLLVMIVKCVIVVACTRFV